MTVDDVTVLIPFLEGGNETWLRQAIGSLPKGVRYMVLRNQGELADALNQGLRDAETPFVFRLDADDLVFPGCLEFLADLAWDCDVTYPTLVFYDENLEPMDGQVEAPKFSEGRLQIWNLVPGCSLFSREKALQVGGFRDLPMWEDWDLWVRMWRDGCRFKPVPEARVIYRQHGDSRNKQIVPEGLVREICGDEPEFKATWYHQHVAATAYWRCQLPARHLPGVTVANPEILNTGSDDDPVVTFPRHRGAGIWQFPGDHMSAICMVNLQDQGVANLVEVDDNYLAPSRYMGGWTKGQDSSSSLETHRNIVEKIADGVIVTTDHLGRVYRKANDHVFVCPNQIDPADWQEPDTSGNSPFRVGWFGSLSHKDDTVLVKRALEWASKQDGVEVVCMGVGATRVIGPGVDVHRPWWTFRYRHIPWSNDMGVYRKMVGMLDVGLAPVKPNPWSNCRSDLKALEYSMGGAASIVSNETPYESFEGPCLRARNAKDFLNHVKYLVNHQDEAKQMAADAKAYVLKRRTVAGNIWRWEEALATVSSN